MLSQTSASISFSFDFIVEMRFSRRLCPSPSFTFALCCKNARHAVSNAESIKMTASRFRCGMADPRRSSAPNRVSITPRIQGLIVAKPPSPGVLVLCKLTIIRPFGLALFVLTGRSAYSDQRLSCRNTDSSYETGPWSPRPMPGCRARPTCPNGDGSRASHPEWSNFRGSCPQGCALRPGHDSKRGYRSWSSRRRGALEALGRSGCRGHSRGDGWRRNGGGCEDRRASRARRGGPHLSPRAAGRIRAGDDGG